MQAPSFLAKVSILIVDSHSNSLKMALASWKRLNKQHEKISSMKADMYSLI